MKTKTLASAMLATALLMGCAGLSDTEQRALTGTAGGAAGGAIIGAIAGDAALGAGIGAAAGLAGGLLYDYHRRSQDTAYSRGYAAGAARN